MRNLTKTIATVSLLAPASVYPLGIGDIKLHSALNQNLDAEIALIISAGENVSNLHVSLAPPEKFDEAGVPWSYFLAKIKFESITRADGSVIVKLSSEEAMREPFLDFLLEVTWSKGNLYREFTVLIDPPTAYTQPVIPVIQKAEPIAEEQKEETVTEETVAEEVAVALLAEDQIEEAVVVEDVVEDVAADTEDKQEEAVAEDVALLVEAEQEEAVAEEEVALLAEDQKEEIVAEETVAENVVPDAQYGPTNIADTLWSIAERTNIYDDVSIEQMMMAIYLANPQAFHIDNMNTLMADQTLVIPEKEIIFRLSKKDAKAEFKRQGNVWKGLVADKTQDAQSISEKTDIDTQLELEPPVEDEITDKVVVAETDVSTDSAESKSEKLAIASSGEEAALQAKLDKLESQLVTMQKKLSLKDEELAALQIQEEKLIKAAETAKALETVKAIETAKALEAAKAAETTKALEAAKTAEASKAVETTKAIEATKAVEAVEAVKPVETAKAAEVVAKAKAEAAAKAEKAKAAAKAKAIEAAKPAETTTDFMSDTLTPVIGGVGVVIFGLLGLLFWRKRQNEKEAETDSMFATASEISLPDSSVSVEGLSVPVGDDTSSYDVGTVGESSFLSEFTPSDFDAFDTDQDEVDPISEADVYLAYGRYQQAEDLMRQAIVDQPERDECKLKLLEIFYANENGSAFEEYASELVSSGKNNDQAFWAKVVEMGTELSPDSSLYTEAGDKATFETEELDKDAESEETVEDLAENAADEQTGDDSVDSAESPDGSDANEVDFDLSIFDQDDDETETEIEAEETELEAAPETESEIELETELETEPEIEIESELETEPEAEPEIELETELEPETEDKTDDNSLDFDLSGFDDETESDTVEELDVDNEEIESVDFDLNTVDLDELSVPSEDELENNEVDESESNEIEMDSDLDSFDFSLDDLSSEPETTDSEELESTEEAENFDEFDFDLDTPSTDSDSIDDSDLGVSDLTDMDELETKIDLAKAYIDMGDSEAAKGIAEEVMEKGNEEQKIAAQAILDQLN